MVSVLGTLGEFKAEERSSGSLYMHTPSFVKARLPVFVCVSR